VVCRFGETGFGIILPGTGVNGLMVRQRLERRFEQWMATRTTSNSDSVRIGHAIAPEQGRSAQELLVAAEPVNKNAPADKAA
jgi:hypothetical protein